GAIGILQIPPQRMMDFMKGKAFQDRAATRETVRLAREAEGRLPTVALGPALADELLSVGGLDLKQIYETAAKKQKFQGKKLDVTAKIAAFLQSTRVTTQNVAAVLEGTDPKLKNEYVAFSAHYDHLKTNANGEIYPGA